MLSYVYVGTNDLARAIRFYEAVLGAVGMKRCITSDAEWDKVAAGWGTYEDGGARRARLLGWHSLRPEEGDGRQWHDGRVPGRNVGGGRERFPRGRARQWWPVRGCSRPPAALCSGLLCRLCARPRWEQDRRAVSRHCLRLDARPPMERIGSGSLGAGPGVPCDCRPLPPTERVAVRQTLPLWSKNLTFTVRRQVSVSRGRTRAAETGITRCT